MVSSIGTLSWNSTFLICCFWSRGSLARVVGTCAVSGWPLWSKLAAFHYGDPQSRSRIFLHSRDPVKGTIDMSNVKRLLLEWRVPCGIISEYLLSVADFANNPFASEYKLTQCRRPRLGSGKETDKSREQYKAAGLAYPPKPWVHKAAVQDPVQWELPSACAQSI